MDCNSDCYNIALVRFGASTFAVAVQLDIEGGERATGQKVVLASPNSTPAAGLGGLGYISPRVQLSRACTSVVLFAQAHLPEDSVPRVLLCPASCGL